MKFDTQTYRLVDKGRFGAVSLGVAAVGLVLSAVGFTNNHAEFYHAWLTGLAFWVSLGLGALLLTLIHHLTNATWSVVVRRLTESVAMTLPVLALPAVVLFFGMHELYHWSHPEVVAEDAVLQWKSGYLNVPFFIVRTLFAFAVWSWLAVRLYRLSARQDERFDLEDLRRMRRVSAGGLLLFALTVTMIGFDWLMSLDPHWYSTIYGVYFFSGSLLGAVALVIVLAAYLRGRNVLQDIITVEHYHDLGKLAFGFVIFWAYSGYSQYLLQWYANIPEETVWYLDRWRGSWVGISLLIFFGHFVAPFTILVFRWVKRHVPALCLVALWILLMHLVDIIWLVYPTYKEHGLTFAPMEMLTLAGPFLLLGGLAGWTFWNRYTRHALVPVADPKLPASIAFTNQ